MEAATLRDCKPMGSHAGRSQSTWLYTGDTSTTDSSESLGTCL
jgi:hypothetical protein